MPPTNPSVFDELTRLCNESGIEKSLDFLEHHFRRDKEYFKLFEVLKMRCRHRIGLPIIYSDTPDELDEGQQRELEDALIGACREVGTLFFKAGKLQEGWMYLQPVGDKTLSEKLIRSIPPDEDNTDAIVDVAITQGAAPIYGYQLMLKHYGTCNGITTYDTQAGRFDKATEKGMARELLHHLYEELVANIRYAIGENNPDKADAASKQNLAELMNSHPDLTVNGAHHIDTTHLASLMRIARAVDDPQDLELACQLAKYGTGLAEDFCYPGSPPFENTYQDHLVYFRALVGKDVDEAVAHFEKKITADASEEFGPVVEETFVDFLVRLGKTEQAISFATEKLLGKHDSLGIAPNVLNFASTSSELKKLMEYYQAENDLLGFGVCLLKGGK
ncbi:MAG: hypothetical protein AB8B55_23570 [Mariniblastus sp.]